MTRAVGRERVTYGSVGASGGSSPGLPGNKAHLQEFGEMSQAWMISQIPGGANGLDQLVCDGKTLRGSAIETDGGNHRYGHRPTPSMSPRSPCTPRLLA
jgi:hypothetical protein